MPKKDVLNLTNQNSPFKEGKDDPEGRRQSRASCSLNPNLTKRNQALLYALGGFAVLLYFISFVRMGQW